MICQKCDGRGKTTEYDGLRKFWCDYKCEVCNGTGEVMTEQEYLQTCNTEQLAEMLFRICERATWDYNVKIMVGEKRKDLIVEWLKQPHNSPK